MVGRSSRVSSSPVTTEVPCRTSASLCANGAVTITSPWLAGAVGSDWPGPVVCANATVGTVANVKGSTLYVTGTDGTTIKVRTNANSKVTRNADSSVGAVHPGDSVVVQGAKASSGTVTASSITATAKGVSAFGGLAAFGGGGAQGTGSQSGGAAPSGGASGVPQGFAPPQG